MLGNFSSLLLNHLKIKIKAKKIMKLKKIVIKLLHIQIKNKFSNLQNNCLNLSNHNKKHQLIQLFKHRKVVGCLLKNPLSNK